MAQTPQQRRANEKYAKQEAAKRGRPEGALKQKPKQKSPISMGWVVALSFVVFGGLIFEFVKAVPEVWNMLTSTLQRLFG